MIRTMHYDSPIGRLLLAEKDHALMGLWMEGQKYFPDSLIEEMTESPNSAVLMDARRWLDRYFQKERPSADELPLAPDGSDFRKEVWKILCEIPYGTVMTYGEIAQNIAEHRGLPHMSAQAVGGAVGHNPISIIIPCHRVIGTNGSLTGYAGGLEKKIKLLTHEGVDIEPFFMPAKGTAL